MVGRLEWEIISVLVLICVPSHLSIALLNTLGPTFVTCGCWAGRDRSCVRSEDSHRGIQEPGGLTLRVLRVILSAALYYGDWYDLHD